MSGGLPTIVDMSESTTTPAGARPLTTADLGLLAEELFRAEVPRDDGGRLAQVEALERITCAAAASQAVLTASVASSQRDELEAAREAGRRVPRPDSVIGSQVALARHESPREGRAQDRRDADRELSAVAAQLGDNQLREAVRRIVLRMDTEAAAARCRRARAGRHVVAGC